MVTAKSRQGSPGPLLSVYAFHFGIPYFPLRSSGKALRFQWLQEQHGRCVDIIAALECRSMTLQSLIFARCCYD